MDDFQSVVSNTVTSLMDKANSKCMQPAVQPIDLTLASSSSDEDEFSGDDESTTVSYNSTESDETESEDESTALVVVPPPVAVDAQMVAMNTPYTTVKCSIRAIGQDYPDVMRVMADPSNNNHTVVVQYVYLAAAVVAAMRNCETDVGRQMQVCAMCDTIAISRKLPLFDQWIEDMDKKVYRHYTAHRLARDDDFKVNDRRPTSGTVVISGETAEMGARVPEINLKAFQKKDNADMRAPEELPNEDDKRFIDGTSCAPALSARQLLAIDDTMRDALTDKSNLGSDVDTFMQGLGAASGSVTLLKAFLDKIPKAKGHAWYKMIHGMTLPSGALQLEINV